MLECGNLNLGYSIDWKDGKKPEDDVADMIKTEWQGWEGREYQITCLESGLSEHMWREQEMLYSHEWAFQENAPVCAHALLFVSITGREEH